MATADPANKISESSKNQSNIHTTYQVDSITVCNIPPTTKLNHTQSHPLLVSLTTRIRGLCDVFGNKLLIAAYCSHSQANGDQGDFEETLQHIQTVSKTHFTIKF